MSYQQVQNKPSGAYTVSLIGGILGLLGSIGLIGYSLYLYFMIASIFGEWGYYYGDYGLFGFGWTILIGVGIWLLIVSILIISFAKKLMTYPMEHSKWGALIIVFSILSGLNIISLIGGILALTYKPIPVAGQPYGYAPQQQPYGYPPQQYTQTPQYDQRSSPQNITRICPQCGRVVNENLKFCPSCGKQLN